MKNIKIFAFLAVFLLSAFVSTAWAEDVTLTYKIDVRNRGLKPVAHIYNAATGEEVASWDHGVMTLWPAGEGHTMNDDYKITFKPNPGLDKTGKNENKESTSTTAFKTENNTTFTVSVGKEGFYFKSVTFKEDDVEKASFSNIAPNSTSIRVEVPENKFFNYITVVLTDKIHYSLKYDENLTVSPSPSMTYNNIPYYAAGQTVTFGFSGSGSVKYFVNGVRIEGNSVIVRQNLDVQIGVPYIDEKGEGQIRKPGEYTVLTSLTDVSNLGGGWYVVQGEVKYTSQVKFSGDAHLILADEAKMKIETESKYGIYASNNLTIYGQNGQNGILNDTANGTGGYGIYSYSGDITINGGSVTATGGDYGIYSYSGDITINGGSVTAAGKYYGIYSSRNGNITISGGTVEASGYYDGIYGSNGVKISGGSVTATGSSSGIYGFKGVKISGGTVEATGSSYGIYGFKGVTINGGTVEATGSSYGILSYEGVTISGGTVKATGTNGYGIYGGNGVTISGGTVTATGEDFGIYGSNGVTINGGTVTATGGNYGIYSNSGDITLGWTNSTDSIKASNYSLGDDEKHVSIAEGKSFKDEDGKAYSGTLSSMQLDIIKKKTLKPCYAVTFDAQNGDDPIMLLTTFDENGVAHVEKPNDPIRSGFTFEGWFTAKDGNTEFDFTATVTENTIAYAKWSVLYIDEKGKTQIRKPGEYTVLTGNTGVSNLPGGWYVVQGEVKYMSQVEFYREAHLILADGATMEIVTEGEYENGINANGKLNIYGQSEQSGILKVKTTGDYSHGIYSRGNITISGGTVADTATGENGDGIYSDGDITISGGTVEASGSSYGIYGKVDVTISGGTVEASGSSYSIYGDKGVTINGGTVTATGDCGIYGDNGVTINGGKVTATSTNGVGIYSRGDITINGGTVTATGDCGIYGDNGVTINGGKVTATGYFGIKTNAGHIILGWTNSTGFIKASSYYSEEGSVQIAEGKSFKDEDDKAYSGTLTGEQLSAIKGKKLEPCYAVALDLQDGDDPIMLLTTFDENGVAHVAKPADPTRDGFTFEGWFTTKDGNTEFDFTATVTENTTAYAKWSVPYIDENGKTKTVTDYTVLTSDVDDYIENGVINLPGGWYVVQGEVKYMSQVEFYDEAHLILADGATMVIETKGETEYGIYALNNLTIYGQSMQSEQSGILKVKTTGDCGIYSKGNITISGGTVTATGSRYGIYGDKGVTISGGTVTATGDYGIDSKGNITINGGTVAAKGTCDHGIRSSGRVEIKDGRVTATGYDGIYGGNGVTISGGTVTATGSRYGIYSDGDITISGGTVTATGNDGIYGYKGVTIIGGTVEAKGTGDRGIYSDGDITISGGSVTATGNDGIYSYYGVTIIGGSVTATGYYGIRSYNGNITLGWTNSTDFIYASSYFLGDNEKHVSIAEGKSFKDEKGKAYSGTINPVSDIAGKTLVPPSFNGKFLSDVNIAVADIPVQKYADGKPVCPSVVVTDGKDTLKAGTDYTVVCSNNNAITSATLDKAAVAQIIGKGNYAGAIQKRFFIWNNIRDYAAVQVFEDAYGKIHAEIDGAYDGADAVAIDKDIAVESVKFNREFTVNLENGGFSTIMLPFDIEAKNLTGVKSIFEFANIVKIDGMNAVGVNYVWCNATIGKQELEKGNPDCNKLSGELNAYTPYMVEMETPTLGINGNVTLKSSDNATNSVVSKGKWVFRGALQKKEWSKEDDDIKNGQIWAFAGSARNGASIGKFVQFGGNNWVNPFRAYLVDCTTYPEASECKDETQPKPSLVSRYRFADALAPATSAENSLSAKTPAAVAASETALLNSMDIVIVYDDSASGERPTVIGRMNPATGEIRMLPRTKQTYDLKGRKVGNGKKAKGAYYRK